jgi:hypothetical protein
VIGLVSAPGLCLSVWDDAEMFESLVEFVDPLSGSTAVGERDPGLGTPKAIAENLGSESQ